MGAAWSIALAYAAGCISFAALAARIKGIDIRDVGSGNPGATNVGRALGRSWGLAVLALDVAKGAVPAWFLRAPVAELWPRLESLPLLVDAQGRTLIVAAAVLGHVYPVSSWFRGGKGVATLIGGVLVLDPVLCLAGAAAHLFFKKVLGYVSVASVALVWVLPVVQVVGGWLDWSSRFTDGPAVMLLLAVIVTLRHLDNFRRIREGTEDRYDDPDELSSSPKGFRE